MGRLTRRILRLVLQKLRPWPPSHPGSTPERRHQSKQGRTDFPLFPVPTLVPNPTSTTVTQGNLPRQGSDALRAPGLSWVILDREIRSLKIRVSVVRLTRAFGARPSGSFASLVALAGRLRRPNRLRSLGSCTFGWARYLRVQFVPEAFIKAHATQQQHNRERQSCCNRTGLQGT